MAAPPAAAGSTAAFIRSEHDNMANQREPIDYLGHGWGFSWPNDVRILYNRCFGASRRQAVERAQEARLVG